MIYIVVIVCSVLGILLGMNLPTISYSYSGYLAIAIIAALDSVFGGFTSVLKKNFDIRVFVSGFFGNAILAILLTYLGEKLNVDIYLAAVIVFVGRMFTNLSIIRRFYIEKWSRKIDERKERLSMLKRLMTKKNCQTRFSSHHCRWKQLVLKLGNSPGLRRQSVLGRRQFSRAKTAASALTQGNSPGQNCPVRL